MLSWCINFDTRKSFEFEISLVKEDFPCDCMQQLIPLSCFFGLIFKFWQSRLLKLSFFQLGVWARDAPWSSPSPLNKTLAPSPPSPPRTPRLTPWPRSLSASVDPRQIRAIRSFSRQYDGVGGGVDGGRGGGEGGGRGGGGEGGGGKVGGGGRGGGWGGLLGGLLPVSRLCFSGWGDPRRPQCRLRQHTHHGKPSPANEDAAWLSQVQS